MLDILNTIFLCLIALALLTIAFFLFAMWRAIIGKSSVDLHLNTSLDRLHKDTRKQVTSQTTLVTILDSLKTEFKEFNQFIKNRKSMRKDE
tara:strand:+ start:53940 stop:54212 length:273 start_codon:yes stop_codon:yes gene_type:complete